MESYLRTLARGQPADYVEIRLEDSRTTQIAFRGPILDSIGESTIYGGNVRALVNGGWGFVISSLEDLEPKVRLAVEQATVVSRHSKRKSQLAPVPVVTDKVSVDLGEDLRKVLLAKKRELLEGYNQLVLGHGRGIASSSIRHFDYFSHLRFANSEGTYAREARPRRPGAGLGRS